MNSKVAEEFLRLNAELAEMSHLDPEKFSELIAGYDKMNFAQRRIVAAMCGGYGVDVARRWTARRGAGLCAWREGRQAGPNRSSRPMWKLTGGCDIRGATCGVT